MVSLFNGGNACHRSTGDEIGVRYAEKRHGFSVDPTLWKAVS
ncbi:hypothetical protein Q7O_004415 [Pectobacterium carotovorum subsp. carotovorum PCCS1]|nr:hypothetical protein [Pectobacterium carotovorum subsp. carotovorum PCCS1]